MAMILVWGFGIAAAAAADSVRARFLVTCMPLALDSKSRIALRACYLWRELLIRLLIRCSNHRTSTPLEFHALA